MSYSFGMFFKQCESFEDAFATALSFTKACRENAMDLLKINQCFIPSFHDIQYRENLPADKFWLYELFSFSFIYWPQYNLLGVSGYEYPKDAKSLFDAHVQFQNSCDQDYEYETWSDNVDIFSEIKSKVLSLSIEDMSQNHSYFSIDDFMENEDYYRKSFLYDSIYDSLYLDNWLNGIECSDFKSFKLCAIEDGYQHSKICSLLRKVVKEKRDEDIREFAEMIISKIYIDVKKFVKLDLESDYLTGPAVYSNHTYTVTLSSKLYDSYELQAAMQIVQELGY